jgi:parvulin-like peptidyl-prolyl isomerase
LIGGDLGIFAAARALPEFVAQIEKLRIGQISAPFQTSLGFHIAQLTEVKPPRQLTYDEARAEIHQQLRNEKRAAAVARVAERLRAAEFVRSGGH